MMKLKTRLILLLLLSMYFSSFAQNQDLVNQYQKELEDSYKQNSNPKLEDFLNKWNESLKPDYPSGKFPNDTIKIVYEIYNEFYKLFDLLKLGDWEWGNKLNSNSKFTLVQNKIQYQ